jgi:hypothetical protein
MLQKVFTSLLEHALETLSFPVYAVAVSASGLVFAVRFEEAGRAATVLCEHAPDEETFVLPFNIYFSDSTGEAVSFKSREMKSTSEGWLITYGVGRTTSRSVSASVPELI